MNRVDIYEYDRKNRSEMVSAANKLGAEIVSWTFFVKDQIKFEFPEGTKTVLIDLTTLFSNEERVDALLAPAELLLNLVQQSRPIPVMLIIERQYSLHIQDILYYKIGNILSLEEFLEMEKEPNTNIVDINQKEFDDVSAYLNNNLFGNTF